MVISTGILCGAHSQGVSTALTDSCPSVPLSPGDAWRLEDDGMDPPGDAPLQPQLRTAVEDAPFSHFRMRSFYMRKSLSVDNHLGSLGYAVHPAETKAERVRTRLRRQFVSTWADGTHPRGSAEQQHGRGLAVRTA